MNTTEINAGSYSLTDFPGSEKDIIISHGAFINPDFRGKGLGQKLHKERINKVRHSYNASLMMCVVNSDNLAQIHILDKFGWKPIHRFLSECSCHQLIIYVREPWIQKGMVEG